MKRINIPIFIIIVLLSAPASAQFYKYIDEDGNIRFTDDINQVPENQRATVKSYEEAVSDTGVAKEAGQSDSEVSTNAQQKAAAAGAAVDIDLGDLDAAYIQLKALRDEIDKEYSKELYDKHFAFYIDNILSRIELQEEAYRKEENIPPRLFEIYEEQKKGLQALKDKYGSVVSVQQITKA